MQLPKVGSPTPNIEMVDCDKSVEAVEKHQFMRKVELYFYLTSIYLWPTLQHIDTYLTVLREKQTACPANYDSLIIYHGTSLFGELSHYWKRDFVKRGQVENFKSESYVCPDSWLTYVRGEQYGTRPWWHIDEVLLPCCIDNYHWILCKINLRKKVIVIYDSLQKHKDPTHRISQIDPLIKFLPSMLRCGGFFEKTGIAPWTDGIKVEVLSADLLPQQPDGTSCGAFVMKYLDNIMRYKELNWDFVEGDVNKIREEIAMEIFAYSIPVD
ncbi:hypothetical protein ACOSQ2_022231 [Xanthoceras sorbifolium]